MLSGGGGFVFFTLFMITLVIFSLIRNPVCSCILIEVPWLFNCILKMCKTDHISRLLIQKNTFSSEGHLNHKTTGSSWSLPDLNMRHTHTPLNVLLCKSVVTPHLKKIPMPSQHNSAWLLPPTNRDETAGQNLKNTKKDNDWWSVVVAPLLYTSWIMLFGQSFIFSDLFFSVM